MTTLYASANAIRREAKALDPVKVLITLVALVPFLLGWTARLVWVLISVMWTGAVYGWRSASTRIEATHGSS